MQCWRYGRHSGKVFGMIDEWINDLAEGEYVYNVQNAFMFEPHSHPLDRPRVSWMTELSLFFGFLVPSQSFWFCMDWTDTAWITCCLNQAMENFKLKTKCDPGLDPGLDPMDPGLDPRTERNVYITGKTGVIWWSLEFSYWYHTLFHTHTHMP